MSSWMGRSAPRVLLAALALGLNLAFAASAPPIANAAEGLEITTDYPAVAVAPGRKVSFDLRVTSDREARVALSLEGVPDGWTATLNGGGFVVDGVTARADAPTEVRLDVTVPADATGTTRITVRASDGERRDDLPLDLRVSESAEGDISLTTDVPRLQGPADTEFRFTLTLRNDTPEDLTFTFAARGPEGWQVETRLSGQEQAASATVESGSTATLQVTAEAPPAVEAGQYPIAVEAVSGSRRVGGELGIEITGSYELSLRTPDERLNLRGSAGSPIRQTILVENGGTAPLENVTFSHSAPTGWTVTFEPETLASVPAGERGEVTVVITPSSDAIAGDYVVSIDSSNEEAEASAEFRVTVETSLLWGAVGLLLILAVAGGLALVFRRYGRR